MTITKQWKEAFIKCGNNINKIIKIFSKKKKHPVNNLNLKVTKPTVLDASVYGDLVKKSAFIFILSSDNRCGKHPTKY